MFQVSWYKSLSFDVTFNCSHPKFDRHSAQIELTRHSTSKSFTFSPINTNIISFLRLLIEISVLKSLRPLRQQALVASGSNLTKDSRFPPCESHLVNIRQIRGGAMGSAFAQTLANIFMLKWEHDFVQHQLSNKEICRRSVEAFILCLFKYIDDGLITTNLSRVQIDAKMKTADSKDLIQLLLPSTFSTWLSAMIMVSWRHRSPTSLLPNHQCQLTRLAIPALFVVIFHTLVCYPPLALVRMRTISTRNIFESVWPYPWMNTHRPLFWCTSIDSSHWTVPCLCLNSCTLSSTIDCIKNDFIDESVMKRTQGHAHWDRPYSRYGGDANHGARASYMHDINLS